MMLNRFLSGGLTCYEFNKHNDNRGFFFESYGKELIKNLKTGNKFVQDNISYSKKNVLRGFHYQKDPQEQLIYLIKGKIQIVFIDINKKSKTFLKKKEFLISEKSNLIFYMKKGISSAFLALGNENIIGYKVSKFYNYRNEAGFSYLSKFANVKWKSKKLIIGEKDKKNMELDINEL